MIAILAFKDYTCTHIDIATTETLIAYMEKADINTQILMKHTSKLGAAVYTDIRAYLSEKSPIELPTTIQGISDEMTDKEIEGYSVPNPTKIYGRKIITRRLLELKDPIRVEVVNINQPDVRKDLAYGQGEFDDIVISSNDPNISVENIIFIKDGRYVKPLISEGEAYYTDLGTEVDGTNHVIIDMNDVNGCKIHYIQNLTITTYADGYSLIKLNPGQYFTQVPWIIFDGILYDLPNPHIHIIDAQTLKLDHDFPHIETPGMRAAHPELSDVEYAAYRIDELLNQPNSIFMIPSEKIYVMKYVLTKLDDLTYFMQSNIANISGIVMVSYHNSIVPFKILASTKHNKTGMYQYTIRLLKVPRSLSADEHMRNPDNVYYLQEPYHPSSRVDVRLISAST